MPTEPDSSLESDAVRCYAIRRVNPFLGVLQVIKTSGGRAISANGVVWDIEIRAEKAADWGSLNRHNRQAAYYRYGLWSMDDGLVSRPLASNLDGHAITLQCNLLIDCIRERIDQLPFTLEDRLELWLFDQADRKPLALLASAIPGDKLPSPEPRYWKSHIGADGVPSQHKFPAAGDIEAMVKKRAGFNIHKHWVTRNEDGSGLIEASNTGLNAEAFPVYLLAEEWPEPGQTTLAREYIDWISPSLLTLHHLHRQARARLEKSLNVQAVSVEHHWHLYPEIIDEHCINAARVQCRLEKSNLDSGSR